MRTELELDIAYVTDRDCNRVATVTGKLKALHTGTLIDRKGGEWPAGSWFLTEGEAETVVKLDLLARLGDLENQKDRIDNQIAQLSKYLEIVLDK